MSCCSILQVLPVLRIPQAHGWGKIACASWKLQITCCYRGCGKNDMNIMIITVCLSLMQVVPVSEVECTVIIVCLWLCRLSADEVKGMIISVCLLLHWREWLLLCACSYTGCVCCWSEWLILCACCLAGCVCCWNDWLLLCACSYVGCLLANWMISIVCLLLGWLCLSLKWLIIVMCLLLCRLSAGRLNCYVPVAM